MSKMYTLEDVETLRSKAGIRYEEAVELLDKYDGDTTRALIELEKRGRLSQMPENRSNALDSIWEYIKQLWSAGMNTCIRVERRGETLVNLSVIVLLFFLILGPYAMIAGLILVLISGCNLRIHSVEKAKSKADTAEKSDSKTTSAEESSDDSDSSDDDFPSVTIS